MALPEDFNKIYGSTATGGLTPINDVDYAKGWEFVGANPPTKNDFSYLQNLSDLKSQWLYANKLQRTDPFGDIKSDGTAAVARSNLGLGTAATMNVGTDTGQVPDMSSFTTGYSESGSAWTSQKSGWSKGPDGVITQWGVFGFIVGQTGTNVVFPVPFPTRVESIILTFADIQESVLSPTAMPAIGVNSVGTSRTGFTARMSGGGGFNLCYLAKGR